MIKVNFKTKQLKLANLLVFMLFAIFASMLIILAVISHNNQSPNSSEVLGTALNSYRLNPQQFAAALAENPSSSLLLIDLRTQNEYRQGHIQNAVNWNVDANDFQKKIIAIDKSKIYFIYDRIYTRSLDIAEQLLNDNVQVFVLKGGLQAWKEAGLSLVN